MSRNSENARKSLGQTEMGKEEPAFYTTAPHTQLVYIIREMSPVSRIIEWAHNSGQDLAFDLLFWSETLVLYNLHAHPKYSEIQTPFSGPSQVVIYFMLRGIYLLEKAMSCPLLNILP